MQNIFSNYNGMKLEIDSKRKLKKIYKYAKICPLNSQRFRQEIIWEIINYLEANSCENKISTFMEYNERKTYSYKY